ncbi:MAG: MFS transporter [Oscillospiraceae bacterium]
MSNNKYSVLKTQHQYLKMLAADVINRFGDSVDSIAYGLMIYSITGSAALMALIMAINYLPTIVLQPVAGVLVDRLNKQRVMVLCDIGRGLAVMMTAMFYFLGKLNSLIIVISVILNSTLEALRVPASSAFTPTLLDEENYAVGSGLSSTLGRLSEIIGLVLAGGIVGLFGKGAALLIDAGTFFISAVLIRLIRASKRSFTPSVCGMTVSSVLSGLVDGLKYVRNSGMLISIIFLGMIINFVAVPLGVLITAYVTDDLSAGAELLSAIQLSMGAGAALGAFIAPKLSRVSFKLLGAASGISISGTYIFLAFIPVIGSFALRVLALIGIIFLLGTFIGILSLNFNVAFMRAADDKYRGRVTGVTNSLLCCIMPAASLLLSALTLKLTVSQTFFVFGLLALALFILAGLMKVYSKLGDETAYENRTVEDA